MEYQIAISPELQINPEEFVSAWNDEPELRQKAVATLAQPKAAGYPLDPELIKQGLIFLAGFAGSIVADAVKDMIKQKIKALIEKKFGKQQQPAPAFEVVLVDQHGAPLIVVKEQE
jgi:hypothetical protein